MVLAIVVNCVPLLLREGAILALLIACVGLCALLLHVCDEAVEGVVLPVRDHPCILVKTVWALLVWSVVALGLCRGQ